MIEAARRVLTDHWTYLRLVYLLLAFPLGIIYFVGIVTGVAVGLGLSVIGIGLAVLVLTLIGWIAAARLERELAIHLLGAQIRPFSRPETESLPPWPLLLRTLREPTTWKGLTYLLVEFPFGVFSFTVAVTLLTVSLALVLLPVAYVVALAVPSLQSHINVDVGLAMNPGSRPFGAQFLVVLILGAAGLGLGVGSLAALSGLGWLWGRFAELMLGVDESRLQLAAAQAEAQSQRGRAERADQSRRELIVNASHELRTPIASISAHVESLMKPGREIDTDSRQYIGVIDTETKRLSSLVDDLLVLARADADELKLRVGPVDVAAVVTRVCTVMAPLARQERNLSLVQTGAHGVTPALADPDRLEQVLGNLVRNAVNNTPDGGIITVDVSPDTDGVSISVADTGIGIDAADLPRIFDRFYRTDQSRTRDSGGSGLGLAIVRELVAAMGGSITAESMPGRGSTFKISLRRAP